MTSLPTATPTSTPLGSPFDLLREKRQELGLPDPAAVAQRGRERLVQGVAIGAVLVGLALGVAALVLLRAVMVRSALDRLGTVEAEVQLLDTQLTAARTKLKRVERANGDLVKGLVAVRSGSAVLRDLQLRVPEGVQLTSAVEEGAGYRLKGVSRDPEAFARINALQLQLKRSPLVDPNGVTLVKASRGGSEANAGAVPVSFELLVKGRPPISPLAEKQILRQLGAEGLVRRLDLLQKEGLLR